MKQCPDCKGTGLILDNGKYQGKVSIPWADRIYLDCIRCFGGGQIDEVFEFNQEIQEISEESDGNAAREF